ANLLVDKQGVVKILDMGLARFTDESQGSLTREYDQKMIGTVDYLAPEQAIDSHKVDLRVDIYSLGCTLYFMLTGDAPFPQGTIPQRLMQHQSADPTDVRKLRPDAPGALIAICKKMMAKSADDRYQSGDAVAEALSDWLGDRESADSASGNGSTVGGVSLNENLSLAPLDDEPARRTVSSSRPDDTAPGSASKTSVSRKTDAGSKSGVASNSGAGAKSGIKPSGTVASGKGESSSVTGQDIRGEKSNPQKPRSGASAPRRKSDDLMDDLLAPPPAGHTSGPMAKMPSSAGRNPHHPGSTMPMWLTVALAVVCAFVVGGLLLGLLLSWDSFSRY
ncbi:MAG TPA: serine/threonine-protein kinase, partial [Acetobacteraceae bacterium]|nr:serine/threonine-protein kinase [Acetobacteraceae bacterium]